MWVEFYSTSILFLKCQTDKEWKNGILWVYFQSHCTSILFSSKSVFRTVEWFQNFQSSRNTFIYLKSVFIKFTLKSMKCKKANIKTVLLLWNSTFPAKIIALSSERVAHNCWFQKCYFMKSAVVLDPLRGLWDDYGGKLTISQ